MQHFHFFSHDVNPNVGQTKSGSDTHVEKTPYNDSSPLPYSPKPSSILLQLKIKGINPTSVSLF